MNIKKTRKPNNYWTKEKCSEEAKKYLYKVDFIKNSEYAYNLSLKKKWLNEICKHMIPLGHKYKRIVYVYEFSDNFVYVGLTHNEDQRKKRHLSKNDSAVYLHIAKTNLTPLYKRITLDYINVYEAQNLEKETIIKYQKEGWNILNRTEAGSLGSNMKQWTKKDCIKDAKKYNSRTEWANNSNMYRVARKKKWLDICCKHMKEIVKPSGYWTKEKCIDSAKKYKTKSAWQKKYPSAYQIAFKKKWLNECCKHMVKATDYSTTKKNIIQFSINGEKINEFTSILEAERITKINNSHISSCCKNKRRYAGGFIWQYKNEKIENMINFNQEQFKQYIKSINKDKIKKPVLQFDLNNNLIKEFESISEASRKTNISNVQIGNCCIGKCKTSGGFIWKYANQL